MSKASTKPELVQRILATAGNQSLTKANVNAVLAALNVVIPDELKSRGVAIIPGLVRFRLVQRPPTKARNSVNPFTKQPMTVPAKPARTAVKTKIAKSLKDRSIGATDLADSADPADNAA